MTSTEGESIPAILEFRPLRHLARITDSCSTRAFALDAVRRCMVLLYGQFCVASICDFYSRASCMVWSAAFHPGNKFNRSKKNFADESCISTTSLIVKRYNPRFHVRFIVPYNTANSGNKCERTASMHRVDCRCFHLYQGRGK